MITHAKKIFIITMSSLCITAFGSAHISEQRPWGFYEIISETDLYKIKKIVVFPHKRLSLQRHKFRAEYWIILEGNGLVTLNEQQTSVEKGATITVKQQDLHRVENTGESNLIFIEVQTGTYFGEDDIERLSDDYGRTHM